MNSNSLMNRQKFLGEEDMAALITFAQHSDSPNDDQQPLNRDSLSRLSELGAVSRTKSGGIAMSAFGHWLVETEFEQSPTLPLRTNRDIANSKAKK